MLRTQHDDPDVPPTRNSDIYGRRNRRLMMKVLIILSMIMASSVFGALAFKIATKQEQNIAIHTYESMVHHALEEAHAIAQRKQQGAESLAMVLSYTFLTANRWPFVGFRGYSQIASRVAALSGSQGHGFSVIVQPDQVEAFEAHAVQLYQQLGNAAGWSEFGFGIYGIDPAHGKRFHDTDGNTTWGNRYDILVPLLQQQNLFTDSSSLMRNLHQSEPRGIVIESIIDCAKASDPNSTISPNCGGVTNFTDIDAGSGIAAVFFTPVYPADNPTTVVGFIETPIAWEEVLTKIVPDYVHGLDCVVSNGEDSYTYTIVHGQPYLIEGKGDFHNHRFEEYARSVALTKENTGTNVSATFTLTLYPTEATFDAFQTSMPVISSVGFVAVILFCSVIFFLYDHVTHQAAHQQKLILNMKRRFVRFISHEVRTPMNVVCMGLDLLQTELNDQRQKDKQRVPTGTPDDDATKVENKNDPVEYVDYWYGLTQEILENSHNAVSVLNDLLNYDKIESKSFTLEKGRVSIWSSLKRTVHEFSIQARNRQIDLDMAIKDASGQSVDVDDTGLSEVANLFVFGDDRRLSQVFRNLVSNALKFTPDGKRVTVTATYSPGGLPIAEPSDREEVPGGFKGKESGSTLCMTREGSIIIRVTDEGVGLSRDQVNLLFNEGVKFNADILQAGGGSGLGLCIAKEIVEMHQGTILVESDGLGCGSSFQVELPLYKPPKGELNRNQTGTTSIHSSSDSRLVLVVDDVLTNTKMLVRLLERAGHECITAKNGKEAIDAYAAHQVALGSGAKSRPIDTVLMDFEMPGMNGPDATRRMREMGCGAYIFGVTGNVLIEDVTTFKESGADLVIFKPINLNAIDEAWDKMEDSRPHILEPGKDSTMNGRLTNCLAVNKPGIRHRHDKEREALATTLPLVCTHDRTNGGHTRIIHTD